jgi:hypothetical protein
VSNGLEPDTDGLGRRVFWMSGSLIPPNAELSGNRRRRVSSERLRSPISAGKADSPQGCPLE